MSRSRVLLAALAVLGLALAATSFTGARYTSRTTNAGNALTADKPSSYLRIYSQSTNPGGLTGYAVRAGKTPSTPAATGTDETLEANLGGFNNVSGSTVNRVFTLTTGTLPAGVSSITVELSTVADPTTGSQPISDYTFATTSGTSVGKTVTVGPNNTGQINLTIRTNNLSGNRQYVPKVVIRVTYPGYSGNFLSYVVPIKIYDGSGAGPN